MKSYEVEPTKLALADADEAFVWLYQESPDAAVVWYEGLMTALHSLSKNPQRCSFAPESPVFRKEVRQLLYGRYRIIFTVSGRAVHVLRIRHSARLSLTEDI